MIMIAVYAAGYLLTALMPEIISFLYLNPALVLRGQIWRVITWVLVPPESLSIFTLIMLYFYFSLGRTLEYTWGSFRFNVYILSGVVFTVIGAFLLYFFTGQEMCIRDRCKKRLVFQRRSDKCKRQYCSISCCGIAFLKFFF